MKVYCPFCSTEHDITGARICPVLLLPIPAEQKHAEQKMVFMDAAGSLNSNSSGMSSSKTSPGAGSEAASETRSGSGAEDGWDSNSAALKKQTSKAPRGNTDATAKRQSLEDMDKRMQEGGDRTYVRICHFCHHQNNPARETCALCGTYLDDLPVPRKDPDTAASSHTPQTHSATTQHHYFIESYDSAVRCFLPDDGKLSFCPTDGTSLGAYLLKKPYVSGGSVKGRRHAVIHVKHGTMTISDDGSTNGTYVNGIRTEGDTELHRGDLIGLGSSKTDPDKYPNDAAFFILDRD